MQKIMFDHRRFGLEPYQNCGTENLLVGYVRHSRDYLRTWLVAKNREEAKQRASEVFKSVALDRKEGGFRYMNQEIYLPDRDFPQIREYPYYDVATGKIVMGDFAAIELPTSEALLPDGTPNQDFFILLNRHYVERENLNG